jgi:hypothetical protein
MLYFLILIDQDQVTPNPDIKRATKAKKSPKHVLATLAHEKLYKK